MLSGLAFYLHEVFLGGYFFLLGFTAVALSATFWFFDIIKEATFSGYHTLIVRTGLRYGFLLFIVSEVMLFFGFFWAFFHSSASPAVVLGVIWPPVGITPIPVYEFPLFNTILLIVSGFGITWAHRGIAIGSYSHSIDAFLVTIFLGFFFVFLQMFEYYEAAYNISDSVYGSTFYMLTGLHGMHVIVGASFITICFVRLLKNHYLINHYLGFVFAIWYWHFVDVVWIVLFLSVYCWPLW
jgi:cytochrome c oxidase subunit 3